MALKTNYVDDIFEGNNRKYRQINNSDGTISLSDVTSYSQTGDKFGASDINATNTEVNELNTALMELHTYTLSTGTWKDNTDSATKDDYPYTYTISASIFKATSTPIWDILTTSGGIPVGETLTASGYIQVAYFDTSGIKLYATDKPAVNVQLRVKGV